MTTTPSHFQQMIRSPQKYTCYHICRGVDGPNFGILSYVNNLIKHSNDFLQNGPVKRYEFLSTHELATINLTDKVGDIEIARQQGVDYEPLRSFIDNHSHRYGTNPVIVSHLSIRTTACVNRKMYADYPTVVIAHRFTDDFQETAEATKTLFLDKLLAAGAVICTVEEEKQAILDYCQTKHPDRLQALEEKMTISPVPPSIEPEVGAVRPLNEADNDITFFGKFSDVRGSDEIKHLARAVKNDPYFTGRKIHVVTLENDESREGIRELKALVEKENLPVEFYFNKSDPEIGEIFSRHKYARFASPEGASQKNSSLANMIAFERIIIAKKISDSSYESYGEDGHMMYYANDVGHVLQRIKDHEQSLAQDPELEDAMQSRMLSYTQENSWTALHVKLDNACVKAIENHKQRHAIKETETNQPHQTRHTGRGC